MSERPVSRQPPCRVCDHEEHVYTRCLLELAGGAVCPCPPHHPNGIYI